MKATVSKNELIAMGFKPNQAKTILHDARQVMVKRGKTFWVILACKLHLVLS